MKIALAAGLAVLGMASTAFAQSIGSASETLGSTAPSASGSPSSARPTGQALTNAQGQAAAVLLKLRAEQAKFAPQITAAQMVQALRTAPADQQATTLTNLKIAVGGLDRSLADFSQDPLTQYCMTAGDASMQTTLKTDLKGAVAAQLELDGGIAKLTRQAQENAVQSAETAVKPAAPAASTPASAPAITQAATQAAQTMQKPGSSAETPPVGTPQQVSAALAQLQKSQQSVAQLEKAYPQLSAYQKASSAQQMSAAIALNGQILQALSQAQKAMSTASAQDQKSFSSSLRDSIDTEVALEINMRSLGPVPTGEQIKPQLQTAKPAIETAQPVVNSADLLKQQQAQAASAAEAAAAATAHTKPAPAPAPASKPQVLAAAPQKPAGPSPLVKKHKDALAKIKAQQAEIAKRNQAFARLSAAQQQESLKTMMEQSAAIDKAHADMQKEIIEAHGQITKEEQQGLKSALMDSVSQQKDILAMLKEMRQMTSNMKQVGRP